MVRYPKLQDEKDSSDESNKTSCDIDIDHWHLGILRTYGSKTRPQWAILGTLWFTCIVITVIVTAFTTWKISASNIDIVAPARVVASIRQREFTGSPRFDEDKGEYIPPESPSWKYIDSGPKVDSAWEELVKNRYFLLTDEEAKET
ncbi:hypothetical protein F5Y09DRAFT_344192 [Xylaria sp. FL1042]|nr:hypothetical protein F5Y09DRAFT_344192 [Xylaria sp. FL1042]